MSTRYQPSFKGSGPIKTGNATTSQTTKASHKSKSMEKPQQIAVASTRQYRTRPPIMRTKRGAVVFNHTEYFGELNGSTDFLVRGIPINPGNDQLFPYLSNISTSWEYYRFTRLEIRFEPSCASTTPGSIMYCIDYDASDTAPLNKQALMMNQGAVRSAAWSECRMNLIQQASRAQNKRFVLDSSPPPNTDIKLYNLGNLWVATQGMSSTNVVGELYVDYEVELSVPQGATAGDSSVEITLNPTSYTYLNPLAGADVKENAKDRICEVPGVNAENPQFDKNIIRILKAGRYGLDMLVRASMPTGAPSNSATPIPLPGSGISITNSTGSTVGDTTVYDYSIGKWFIEYVPQAVGNIINAGLFALKTDIIAPALASSAATASIFTLYQRALPNQPRLTYV